MMVGVVVGKRIMGGDYDDDGDSDDNDDDKFNQLDARESR